MGDVSGLGPCLASVIAVRDQHGTVFAGEGEPDAVGFSFDHGAGIADGDGVRAAVLVQDAQRAPVGAGVGAAFENEVDIAVALGVVLLALADGDERAVGGADQRRVAEGLVAVAASPENDVRGWGEEGVAPLSGGTETNRLANSRSSAQ